MLLSCSLLRFISMRTIADMKVFTIARYSDYRDFFINFKYFHKSDYSVLNSIMRNYELDFLCDDFVLLPLCRDYHLAIMTRIVSQYFSVKYDYVFSFIKQKRQNCGLNFRERFYNLNCSMTANVDVADADVYFCCFDDILTSGATMLEMRRALVESGISRNRIFGIVMFDSKY